MKFYFKNKTKNFRASDFKRIAKLVFEKLSITDKIELGLKITDNLEIKKLNQKYRGVNQATDVLSFPIDFPDKKVKKENLILGDIVISRQFAQKYSRKDKKTVKVELIELFKHGLLHLLGYDHEKKPVQWRRVEERIKNL
jgi:probable rRNA maturation factor